MTNDTEEVQDDFNVFDDSIDLDEKPEAKAETKAEDNPKDQDDEEGEDISEDDESEEEDPEPPSGKDEKKAGQLEALKAERLKRQEIEKEFKRLKSKYEPDIDPTEPDPSEDPEGYKAWAKEKATQEIRQERIDASRSEMLKVDDYEDKEALFIVLAQRNPDLIEKMNKHPDPARFAYETATKHEADREEKIRQKIMAELGSQKTDDKAKKRKAPDLTGATAIGSNTTQVETMDEDIFKDSPYR